MTKENGIVENNENINDTNICSVAESVKKIINLLTHVFILAVVISCVYYACSETRGVFQLHIIFSVLGYQFLMCQGILVLTQNNLWTNLFSRKTNKNFHIVLQILAMIFVVTGSSLMYTKQFHFKSAHGIFAFLAFITTLASLINGFRRINVYRYLHYLTGIITLFLSAISLCFGLNVSSFKKWTGFEEVYPYLLMVATVIFTILVSFDFFIVTKKKLIFP